MEQHGFHLRCQDRWMLNKKGKKPGSATRASVEKEMAKPRMARSARITELNLYTARIPEHPSQPEKAQIAVDGSEGCIDSGAC